MSTRRVLAIALASFAALWIVVTLRYAPPSPRDANAPRELFSAERARELQKRLLGDGSTRYVATPGNAAGRALIIAELTKLGWTVETHQAMSCTYHGMCAPITNVIAKLEGKEPTLKAVLISAHYDSVPVGPGASDDGVGTATILETARALSEGPRPRRTVVALLDDGEEAGLLGADAFVRTHPLASSIGSTVNVDARGSHGPSQMFETSENNDWLLALASKNVDRPVTTSLFYEVYKRMPNDTDFTATKTIAAGVNFANTAGIEHYHTPQDALEVADIGTLQHHGDHVLGMTRALANDDGVRSTTPRNVVWFDVLAMGIVSWPEPWTLPIALFALALVIGHAIRHRVFDRALFVFLPSLLVGLVSALAAGLLLRGAGATPAPWVAHPLAGLVAIHLAGAVGVVAIAFLFARSDKTTPRALWAGTWIGWGVLGVVLAAVAPGMSYLFVVPTLAAAVLGAFPPALASIAPAVVAAVVVLPLETAIYEALGFVVPPLIGLPVVLLGTTLAPMLSELPRASMKRATLGALVAIAVTCIVAIAMPKFSAASQQRVNVVYRQDEDASKPDLAPKTRVFVDTTWGPAVWGQPPKTMLAAIGAGDVPARESALPWTLPTPFAEVPAAGAPIKAPVLEVLSVSDDGGRHHVRAKVRSPRGATTIALFFPGMRHVSARIDDKAHHVSAVPRPVTGGHVVGLLGVPPDGIIVDFEASGAGAIPMTILDRTYGVPAGTKADDAAHARGLNETPFQDGDVTVITKSLSI